MQLWTHLLTPRGHLATRCPRPLAPQTDCQALQSPIAGVRLEAVTRFRRLLSVERNPPIAEVIRAGAVPALVRLLACHDSPETQFEAAWALTNIASGTSEHTRVVIDFGAVPAIVTLLSARQEANRDHVRATRPRSLLLLLLLLLLGLPHSPRAHARLGAMGWLTPFPPPPPTRSARIPCVRRPCGRWATLPATPRDAVTWCLVTARCPYWLSSSPRLCARARKLGDRCRHQSPPPLFLSPRPVCIPQDTRPSLLRNAAWAVSNLYRGKPPPRAALVASALVPLQRLAFSSDEEVSFLPGVTLPAEGSRATLPGRAAGDYRRLLGLCLHVRRDCRRWETSRRAGHWHDSVIRGADGPGGGIRASGQAMVGFPGRARERHPGRRSWWRDAGGRDGGHAGRLHPGRGRWSP